MKGLISLVLTLIIAFLAYTLYLNIKEPIAFQEVKTARKTVLVNKLKGIRTAQELYRGATGGAYASNFDTLVQVIRNDSIKIVTIFGDKDNVNSTEEFKEVITYKSAMDSFKTISNYNLDSLRYVPFSEGKTFTIAADTMTYQSTLVNIVEVGTTWKEFMGKYASAKYSKFDNSYDPNKKLKFGNLNAPNLSGNWE